MVQQLNTACLIIDLTFEVVGSIFCFGRLCSRLMSAKGTWRGIMMWSKITKPHCDAAKHLLIIIR